MDFCSIGGTLIEIDNVVGFLSCLLLPFTELNPIVEFLRLFFAAFICKFIVHL